MKALQNYSRTWVDREYKTSWTPWYKQGFSLVLLNKLSLALCVGAYSFPTGGTLARMLGPTCIRGQEGAFEGFIPFSRCLHCSKSITSRESVLRVWGYCKSAWCQARLVTVTGRAKLFGQQGPSRGRMRTKLWPQCSGTEQKLWELFAKILWWCVLIQLDMRAAPYLYATFNARHPLSMEERTRNHRLNSLYMT